MSKNKTEKEDGFSDELETQLDAAARGEEVEVTVEDDDGSGIEGGAAAAKKDTDPVEPSVEDLKKQLAAETARREEAERIAEESSHSKRNAQSAAIEAAEAKLALSEQKLNQDRDEVKAKVSDLRRQLREAKENADVEKETEISEAMFDAKIKLAKLDDYEIGLKNYRQRFDAEKTKALEAPDDGGEYLTDAQLADYTPAAQTWIKKHDEFRNSQAFRDKAIRAHHKALGEGIKADTPEYFTFLETNTGLAEPEEDTVIDDATVVQIETPAAKVVEKPKAPAKKPMSSAPPSRMAGNTSQQSGRFRTLTADELDAAEICGMTPDEYRIDKYGK